MPVEKTLADTFTWTHSPDVTRDGWNLYVDGTDPEHLALTTPDRGTNSTTVGLWELEGLSLGFHTIVVKAYNIAGESAASAGLEFTLVALFLPEEPTGGGVWFNNAGLRTGFDASTTRHLTTNTYDALQALCEQPDTVVDFNQSGYINLEGKTLRLASNVYLMGSSAPDKRVTLYNGRVETRTSAGWSDNVFLENIRIDVGADVKATETVNKRLGTAMGSRAYAASDFPDSFAKRMLRGIGLRVGDSQNVVAMNIDIRFVTNCAVWVREGQFTGINCLFGPMLNIPSVARRYAFHGVEHGTGEAEGTDVIVGVSRTGQGTICLKRCFTLCTNRRATDFKNRTRYLCVNNVIGNVEFPNAILPNGLESQGAQVAPSIWRFGTFKPFFPTALTVKSGPNRTRIHIDPLGEANNAAMGADAVFDFMSNGDAYTVPGVTGFDTWQKATNPEDAVPIPDGDRQTWLTVAQFDSQGPSRIGCLPHDRLTADAVQYWQDELAQTFVAKGDWPEWPEDFGTAGGYVPWQTAPGANSYMSSGDMVGRPELPSTLEDHSSAPATGEARYNHYIGLMAKTDYTFPGDYVATVEDNSPGSSNEDLTNLLDVSFFTVSVGANPREE